MKHSSKRPLVCILVLLLLTIIIFAEKVLPLGRRASYAVGVAFLIFGVVVAAGAADLPWAVWEP